MENNQFTFNSIPDLTGKIILVTGGNSGLGAQSVKSFASKGAEVIMASRSVSKGKEVAESIVKEQPKAKIEVMELDLMDLSSIRAFANNFLQKYTKLDVLLNNAGIMIPPYQTTKDGFESQMGTNHLGHFALTGLLLPLIKSTPEARVVNVSSMAHKAGKMDFSNLLYEGGKGYNAIAAYGRSKLANLLFTFELQRYFEKNKINAISVAAHPGVSKTNLFRFGADAWYAKLLLPAFSYFMQEADMGALPQIMASTAQNVKGAQYYGPNGFREMKGYPKLVKPNKSAYNVNDARKLWEVSEKLTGVKFE